jgi:hypothetical protein
MDYIKKGMGSWIADGRPIMGDLILTADKLMFNKKSIGIAALFGVLGSMLAKGKTVLEIDVKDIVSVKKSSFKLNKNVLEFTLKDGSTYSFAAGPVKKWFEVFRNIMQSIQVIE